MADIFISYKPEERAIAKRLAAELEKEGWSVWWDADLVGGQSFDAIIEREMDAARAVIVLWSSRSVKSGYIKDEAAYALSEKKILPVFIEETRLPFRFRGIHTIDMIGWNGSSRSLKFRELVDDLITKAGLTSRYQARQQALAAARQRTNKEETQCKVEAARRKAEQEAAQQRAEAARRKAEQEAAQRKAEAARLKAEQEAAQRRAEAAWLKAEREAAQRKAREAGRRWVEATRKKAAEQAARLLKRRVIMALNGILILVVLVAAVVVVIQGGGEAPPEPVAVAPASSSSKLEGLSESELLPERVSTPEPVVVVPAGGSSKPEGLPESDVLPEPASTPEPVTVVSAGGSTESEDLCKPRFSSQSEGGLFATLVSPGDFVTCKAVRNKEPIGESDMFSVGDKVWVHARVRARKQETVTVIWYRANEELKPTTRLTVKPGGETGYRTYAVRTARKPGSYKVCLYNDAGTPIGSRKFDVE